MARYVFSDFSIDWLKKNKFNDDEIDQLQDLLNDIENRKKKDGPIKVPADANVRVAAMVYLLDSITDADGKPICFEDNGMIEIPDEAQDYFEDDLELEELETTLGKLRKVKFARRYSYPRRRGMMKTNDKFAGV